LIVIENPTLGALNPKSQITIPHCESFSNFAKAIVPYGTVRKKYRQIVPYGTICLYFVRIIIRNNSISDKGKYCTDQEAFDNFVANHPPSLYSRMGYLQWQGSDAKKQLKKDIVAGLREDMGKKELRGSRLVYYENIPLKPFRDKIRQLIRTEKYLYTLKVKGKQHKAS
jgi:hypothetical protein